MDDLRVLVNVTNIDGAGGELARTSLIDVRSGPMGLPAVASITIDAADLGAMSSATLSATVRHEIGHALGIGTQWGAFGLVGGTLADPRFVGANAVAAYSALTGVAQTGVPIDNRANSSSTHWRESVFGNELMTPLLDIGQPTPTSALTVASLKDLGYVVNPAAADGYALPGAGFVFHPGTFLPADTSDGELVSIAGLSLVDNPLIDQARLLQSTSELMSAVLGTDKWTGLSPTDGNTFMGWVQSVYAGMQKNTDSRLTSTQRTQLLAAPLPSLITLADKQGIVDRLELIATGGLDAAGFAAIGAKAQKMADVGTELKNKGWTDVYDGIKRTLPDLANVTSRDAGPKKPIGNLYYKITNANG